MPTLYKARLTEEFSHRSAAAHIRAWLSEHVTDIFRILRFHDEHGQIGSFEGKFDTQIGNFTDELLDEITAILVEALSEAAIMPLGALIATLRKIERAPLLGLSSKLPGAVDWELARHYQRTHEKPGTFWPDAMRIRPNGFNGKHRRPTMRRLKKAATMAGIVLQRRVKTGRRPNLSNELLANKLGLIFLRYRSRITRISERIGEGDKRSRSVERGDFVDFLHSVLPPFRELLRRLRLSPVTPDSIARRAAEIYSR